MTTGACKMSGKRTSSGDDVGVGGDFPERCIGGPAETDKGAGHWEGMGHNNHGARGGPILVLSPPCGPSLQQGSVRSLP
jgi:hypothetical protein